ncbi:MAG TPA: nuclear transport factor 2 family protein [Mycobacterium sp.]|jgi:ketosteroid isomerase-like protein|nr:nuclear transport factor 2 family protein [Mycobacterium sp.]
MSNTAIVEKFVKALGAGDAETGLPLLDPNVQVSEPAGLPAGGEYDGLEAFLGFFAQVAATYDVKIHDVRVIDGGDVALALIDLSWTSIATGKTLETQFVEVYTTSEDKITSISVFPKDTRALYELTVPTP